MNTGGTMITRTTLHRLLLPLLAGMTLSACSITRHSTGLSEDGTLMPCPDAPRCVSSQAEDPAKQIKPFQLQANSDNAWQRLAKIVEGMERTSIVERHENYLHAEVVSPWHFYTDDLELLRAPDTDQVHVRSSARVGYYDFNVNRERVTKLREKLLDADLISRETDAEAL
jgi:uncharacterized protein (DUF1499 family)